jgi:hypothetical protein
VKENPASTRVQADARFEPIIEPDRHLKLLETLERRAGSQRGKPRSRTPSQNPLGGRVFDLNCSWPMYRHAYQGSFRYLCGLYQQSHGSQCTHNHVDGIIATRFVLSCIRQRLSSPNLRQRLEEKLRTLAEREAEGNRTRSEVAGWQRQLEGTRARLKQVSGNLALAQTKEQYAAVASVFEELKQQESTLVEKAARAKPAAAEFSIESEVKAAFAVLDGLADLSTENPTFDNAARLFQRLNAKFYLRFAGRKWGKRTVNQMTSGVVTFGSTPPPIPLHDGPTDRQSVKGGAGSICSAHEEMPEGSGIPPEGEGISLGNVNRGDWIRTSDLTVPNRAL